MWHTHTTTSNSPINVFLCFFFLSYVSFSIFLNYVVLCINIYKNQCTCWIHLFWKFSASSATLQLSEYTNDEELSKLQKTLEDLLKNIQQETPGNFYPNLFHKHSKLIHVYFMFKIKTGFESYINFAKDKGNITFIDLKKWSRWPQFKL